MCGIIGYLGHRPASEVLLDGLRRLEYRGYDSAGIALHQSGELKIHRCKGRINELAALLPQPQPLATCGIGHTRWATHGRPSETNAHPHRAGDVVVVHNGIIENHIALRRELEAAGRTFTSETDTEIFAHLIDIELGHSGGDLLPAVLRALERVDGSYGLGVLHARAPREIVAARRSSPLIVGLGEGESYVASDVPAILNYTRDVVFLNDGDVVRLRDGGAEFFDSAGHVVERPRRRVSWDPLAAEKGGYPHFMLKEIHEQPRAISDTMAGRTAVSEGKVYLDEPFVPAITLKRVKRVVIVACGTSFHASAASAYEFERVLKIPTHAEFASEFRYRAPVLDADTLVVAVSQSGETADTLAAAELARDSGAPLIAVCNVFESSLARLSNHVLYTHAGPEISVASTKAFVTQLISLQLLLLHMAEVRGALDAADIRAWLQELAHLPTVAERVLKATEEPIRALARSVGDAQHMLYLGRGVHYPLAMEGALKLKEISYIHAEAYAAGEMKHGPIALVDQRMPVFAIVHNSPVRDKVIANVQEILARDGRVIALVAPGDIDMARLTDARIEVPSISERVDAVLLSIPLQLFAYYVAVLRGTDVDQPRNLAKSVTVE